MRFRAILVLVPALLIVCAGLDAQEKKKKEDKDRIQGTWQAVSGEEAGQDSPDSKQFKMVFKGDKFTLIKGDNERFIEGTFKLDPSKKPKQVDFKVTGGTGAEEFKDKTALGLYELKKDELKWVCCKPGNDERPKEFATAGTQFLMVVFNREGKK
jgi:uncharacterized protein (TIGR03067 family)